MNITDLRTGLGSKLEFGKKVCVIGSSGILLRKGKGKEIDALRGESGKIVRMNSACIKGFEQDVGSGCDIRVVCYNAVNEVYKWRGKLGLDGEGAVLLLWGAEVHKRKGMSIVGLLAREFSGLHIYEIGQDKLMNFDALFQKFVGVPRLASGAWLSTGWVTLCLLLGCGCEVDVFGMFGGGGEMYHYWDAGRGGEEGHYKEQQFGVKGHRFLTEHKVFVDIWTKIYKLKFIL